MEQHMENIEIEEFWDDLLAFIEQRRIIPVVGAELLAITDGEKRVPLYHVLANSLLRRYFPNDPAQLAGWSPRENHELSDIVCALADVPRKPAIRISDLYRPIHDTLQRLLVTHPQDLQPLLQLAAISDFDLFATTTPDNLLARALNQVRFDNTAQTDEIEYAPKLPTDRRRDIPEMPTSKYTAVFYMFGKSDVSSFYAIHDEDALEFAYTLQAGNGPERMFSQLRNRSLLFIGCTFCDWLSPFFLRFSNSERLFSVRTKREYLVGEASSKNRDFVAFVDHFSQDTRYYSIDARTFVAELYRRWTERNPQTSSGEVDANTAKSGETIFISYSSDDIGAARKLNEGLIEIGADVAWFDKSALKGGDDWNQHIRSAIQRCVFFLPLISMNTQSRTEGFFREEWLEAAERSRKIQGRKFIFPIVIDPDYSGNMGRYALVPEQFRAFQYSHAPGGQMTNDLLQELKEQLRTIRRVRSA
jgi:hypothetical protein